MKKDMICIVCPVGCRLHIDEQHNVTGNKCKRGITYAIEEVTNPTRTITSTVSILSQNHRRLSVKTDKPIPKKYIFDCMKLINEIKVTAPIKIGDIIAQNIFDTGVNIVATSTIEC